MTGARHVVDDDRRLVWDMSAEMARDRARVSVEAAAGGSADDDAQRFAFVESFLSAD